MMAARPQMDHEISVITNELLDMTNLVEETIRNAIKSLAEKNSDLARQIIDGDEGIDDLEDKIKDKCLKFLATQQPLAGDLRYMISIMQMVRDLERIGDHCEDIAKYTLRFENETYIKELVDIPRMADMSARMVKNAIDAFVNKDLRLARKVWKADEEVDELFRNIYDELMGIVDQDAKKANQSVMFLFIAAHLERIADYATNICEETVFAMEGNYEME
ncbi:phosphate signaling complex protein PhoU [Clostridiales bacterium BAD-6]|uniref:Phosphate-specific transport system accessory protein PhoU n=2 Tax=Sinanaerobacter chloroacetimidivorans TaxID=2818044 RepID=A0A8J7W1E3_9FIRM|nr:phosphate signaling complex protein PhoU [Sinanaerobacter chloroacetimidivorans]